MIFPYIVFLVTGPCFIAESHKLIFNIMDRPAAPRPIDKAIAQVHGSSVALDATRDNLNASKLLPTPSLKELIEEKTRENGRLREELAYLQQIQQLGDHLREEVEYVTERLHLAISSFRKGQKDIKRAMNRKVT